MIGRWAIKFPTCETWPLFLRGLLANMQESAFAQWKGHEGKLCPVRFALPLGFANVMPRCERLGRDLTDAEYRDFVTCEDTELSGLVENKCSSFGLLEGRLVAVDFG